MRRFDLPELAFLVVCLLLIMALISAVIFGCANATHTVPGVTFQITGKAVSVHNKSSQYLIFTNITTYQVDDTWIYGRWDSSDVYGRLEVGKTYTATMQGYRIPFMSMYPNILNPIEVVVPSKPEPEPESKP